MTITFGADVVSSLASAAGNTNDQLWPLVVFAVAIPLSFYIMRRLIAIMAKYAK